MSIYSTPSRPRYSDYVPTNLSIYEYLKEKAHPFGTMTALRFYGFEYSYKQLFDNIDKAACALSASGIGKNDIVAISLPGIPEAVYLLYAINKLGAKYCAFDCRSQKDEILDMIKKFGPKLCIVPNFQLKAFRNVTDCEIVYIDPAHSIGKFIKVSTFFADVFTGRSALRIKRKNIVKYDKFINRSNYAFPKTSSERSDDNVFGYFYTSGTTYGRKSIILTNENINSSVYQSSINESYVCAGESMLNIMPMFTCYGVTNATHLPLTLGVSVTLVPLVKTKKFKKLITKEKPNFIITVPAHWEYFARENFKGCDLSYLRTVIVGGDKLDPAYMEKINRIFKECNSSAFLRPGYGLSETTSIGTCSNESTPSGSVGLPHINTLMGIFDHDTLEELDPHQRGEICFYGPSICHGYYKDPEMTAKLLIKHPDGKVWLHTGDMGYTDESGYLYFCERLKRMYVRFDGTKISPYSIEETLRGCEVVHRCLVVPMRDTQHTHGMCARVLVVKKSGISEKDARHAIEKYAHIHLGEHMIPRELVFVERLPYTKNGKLDYFGNYAQDSHQGAMP